MRRLAWALMLGLAFAIPWEYSLDLGPPLGNIARILGLVLLAAMAPAVLQSRGIRRLTALHWLVLALLVWLALSSFWSIDREATAFHFRGYLQEMMIAWFVWELTETPDELRALLRCYVAGSCVLAMLTIANFASADAAGQIRFVAAGQDPNDVARFLDLGFPLGALLLSAPCRRMDKLLAMVYMPMGLIGVLLTASRAGFIAALVAMAGCGIMLARRRSRAVFGLGMALPAVLLAFWMTVPAGTIDRLLTIPQQLNGENLNQRLNIWSAGWLAFRHAPFVGSGAGTFVAAAGLAPVDTAHNTALAIAVEGGVIVLLLATAMVAVAGRSVLVLCGPARLALGTAFLVWLVTSLVATVQENRTTWLLLGMIVAAERLAAEQPDEMEQVFPQPRLPESRAAETLCR
ncbi:MAG TPA: O-antigen ligase family protein [Terracidiphilus sp.]|nr:O-antigen ligase family protein [Terracidiphilus sp.]